MKNEVSVAELLVREGWGDHVPARSSRSRWRVVAVMVAVVLGCGVAALLRFSSGPSHPSNPDQVTLIGMPTRTSGLAGADATPSSDNPVPPNGTGAGGPATGTPAGHSSRGLTPWITSSETTPPSVPQTSETTSPRGDPPPTDSTTTPPSSPTTSPTAPSHNPPSTTTPTQPSACLLFIICI
ncbi:hypothetical protein [Amycolatopsis sp.]|uniref:hypothetical protein n=1 Tax=Amycolatopsis sp. TaxID=37632 RepID=UPI002626AFD7|nr:hypothetical protein [Amycolatopsis sp.]